jgi:hypothetical protein
MTHTLAGLPEDVDAPSTLPQLVQHLCSAKQQLEENKGNAAELRESYLNNLAKAILLKRCPHLDEPHHHQLKQSRIAHEIRELIKREKRRKMFYQIGRCLRPTHLNTSGLASILVPAGNIQPYPMGPDPKTWEGSWTSITDPTLISQHVCSANTRQYNQAADTPFATEPLRSYIGHDASATGASSLLSGSLPPDDISSLLQPETIKLLHTLRQPYESPKKEAQIEITPDDYCSCYKVIPERTSSSPSGCHVGHYKAALHNEALMQLHCQMMSIPFQAGFSPPRWQKVIDVMLEKQPGCPCLRIIALLENDFNQAISIIFARQLGFHMEDHDMVPTKQYGSREGKQCLSAILNKQIKHDIIWHTMTVAAFLENDAQGCYDRMVNNLLLLELQRLGMPCTAIAALHNTWSSACHHIKTMYGISTENYMNTMECPLIGRGQGSTIGPFLWLLLFTLIVNSLGQIITKTYLSSATKEISSQDTGEAFVDDTSLGCTALVVYDESQMVDHHITSSEQNVLENLQELGQLWERLLHATGGAISIEKSFWYMISWSWSKSGNPKLKTIIQSKGSLLLTSGQDTSLHLTVPRIETTASFRTLGTYISPSGNLTATVQHLRTQAINFASNIASSTLNREAIYWAFWQYYQPKVSFSIPMLSLTQAQCTYIQAPAIQAMLSKLHHNRHIARAIVYGPTSYGGLALPDLYSSQGITQLRLLLGHLRLQDKSAKLILIDMSYIQLLLGSSTFFMNLDYNNYGKYTEQGWLISKWRF